MSSSPGRLEKEGRGGGRRYYDLVAAWHRKTMRLAEEKRYCLGL
jgi:hypothetical protein